MNMMEKFDIEEHVIREEKTVVEEQKESTTSLQLYVHNDDINTFDHVIKTLITVCGHSQEQAQQCTLIIHFKGECSVKKGSMETLKGMKKGILDVGIQASII